MGQIFGKSFLKNSNKKAFAAFFNDEMVFKLGKEEIELLKQKYTGAVSWDPSGKKRPMKDCLQVPQAFVENWNSLAKQAYQFVETGKK